MGNMLAHLTRHPTYLGVELSGRADVQEMLELVKRLGAATREHRDNCIMFDMLALQGDVSMGGQMLVGEHIVHWLPHLARVASVVPAAKITRASENVAQSHGVQMKVFDTREQATAWLALAGAGAGADSPPVKAPMDVAHKAVWEAFRHLFPMHAQAIQLPNGSLAISWSIAGESGARYDMATPITVRLEPELLESLERANSEQRKRIAAHQEAAFRAGLLGYDPYAAVPSARVIVLG
ncbi:MAG TPA: STAS/SEC14 domain-containing protein [Ramlibacter sp.]|nr:STAS/SEC14 domain-containing protein [Ramlibacter sp.]